MNEAGMKMPLLTSDSHHSHQHADIMFENVNTAKEKRRSEPCIEAQSNQIISQSVTPNNHRVDRRSKTTTATAAPATSSGSGSSTNKAKRSVPVVGSGSGATTVAAARMLLASSSRVHAAPVTSNGRASGQIMSSPLPMSLHAPPISSNSTLNGTSSAIFCRICYSNESKESLMNWCNCSGTMGLMHKSCLERWLSQSNSNNCEICKFEFKVDKVPRSFKQWLCRPISFRENKNLLNDLVCFLILTPLAVISTWYCILFALKFHETENRWEASGLVVLTSFLLFIYVLWFSFSCKYHYKVFREWQKKNQIVTIKMNDERVVIDMVSASSSSEATQQQTNNNMDMNNEEMAGDITRAESIISLKQHHQNEHLLKFDDDDAAADVGGDDERSTTSPGFQTSSISIDLNNQCGLDDQDDDDDEDEEPLQLGIPLNQLRSQQTKLKRQSTLNIDATAQALSTVQV